MKNGIKVLLGMVGFFIILFFIMYPSSIPGGKLTSYETVEEFMEETGMPFYKIYSLYDYLIEDKKIILGEEKNCIIQHNKRTKDVYSLKDGKHSYQIFYGTKTLDQEAYYKKIGDSEISIQEYEGYLWISYTNKKVSYSINLYVEDKKEYYPKIEQYVKDIEKLNNPL